MDKIVNKEFEDLKNEIFHVLILVHERHNGKIISRSLVK